MLFCALLPCNVAVHQAACRNGMDGIERGNSCCDVNCRACNNNANCANNQTPSTLDGNDCCADQVLFPLECASMSSDSLGDCASRIRTACISSASTIPYGIRNVSRVHRWADPAQWRSGTHSLRRTRPLVGVDVFVMNADSTSNWSGFVRAHICPVHNNGPRWNRATYIPCAVSDLERQVAREWNPIQPIQFLFDGQKG